MNEHYKAIEEKIRFLLKSLETVLSNHYKKNIEQAITHGEYGLALEYLLDDVDENDVALSDLIFQEINSCVQLMEMSWDDLPDISQNIR